MSKMRRVIFPMTMEEPIFNAVALKSPLSVFIMMC